MRDLAFELVHTRELGDVWVGIDARAYNDSVKPYRIWAFLAGQVFYLFIDKKINNRNKIQKSISFLSSFIPSTIPDEQKGTLISQALQICVNYRTTHALQVITEHVV